MSADIIEEPLLTSYEFYDAKESIIVTLFAHGAYQRSDIEVLIETDSLEVRTPTGEKWSFQLYDHVYSDKVEIETNINGAMTQTSIEITLFKQQKRVAWPQLFSFDSTPLIPQTHEQTGQDWEEMPIVDEPPTVDVSVKQFKPAFFETDEKFTLNIMVKQAHACQILFNETNFTATFQTKDEPLLKSLSITSEQFLKLFVRVKERIVRHRCSFKVTPTMIEVILLKENPSAKRWGRLEPSEYSEVRPTQPLSSPTTPPSSPISMITTNPNKAIPLPPPPPPPPPSVKVHRASDKYPSASDFSSAIEQKENKSQPSASALTIGFTGIHNPANSCFMNAALQCLSNTRELRDYFLHAKHLSEINRTNPLGMKGIMAEEFGSVIKNLWDSKYSWTYANVLRSFVAKRHQEFVGNGQHDAQELLTILLDAVHEDLNRVVVKPQVPPVEDQNRPDHVIADEYWRGYLSRNDSVIVELFTGQFKSKTKCPQCKKESVTFDPFTSLSVPLPKRTAVDTIVTYRTDERRPTKYRIIMPADGPVGEFKVFLAAKCGLPVNKMIAYRLRGNRTVEFVKDDERASFSGHAYNNNDIIYITETLTSAECNNEPIIRLAFIQRIFKLTEYVAQCSYCQAPPNPHSASEVCTNCYQVFYCDEVCRKLHSTDHKNYCGFRSAENYETIGIPFIVSLPESKLTYENVFEQISIYAKRSVDIQIERSKRRSTTARKHDAYDRIHSDPDDDDDFGRSNADVEDTFSDIENIDWSTIKNTLSSSDSWSICRLGDYFVKHGNKKRRHRHEGNRKEKIQKNNGPSKMPNGEHNNSSSASDIEEFDMLDDIFGNQPLFRLMPQTTSSGHQSVQPIVEPGEDADKILRRYTSFSIDWFTDNKIEAPLRVIPSKHRHGINDLFEDDSVMDASFGDQDITLQQCLQMFIEPEVLGPDDKWYCPHCKEHMQAEKKMSVWRLPPILIIHLKRFKYHHGSAFGYLSDSRVKIDTHVKYPVHDLNMAPYCSSTADTSQSQYDLFGIVNHRGSAWFGHYTSYARLLAHNDPAETEIGWRNFDDERVSLLSHDKDLVRSDAYVLFYRHRHLKVTHDSEDFTPMVTTSIPMDIYEDSNSMDTTGFGDVIDFLK